MTLKGTDGEAKRTGISRSSKLSCYTQKEVTSESYFYGGGDSEKWVSST